MKHKVISRNVAYHGTPQGALSITGIPAAKAMFEPLVPGAHKVPNTNFYRAPEHGDDLEAFGRWAADRIEEAIEFEGPETVAAVFLEPVQNSGGCFPPPPGYFQRVREICDQHDVLLVSDEVICAFGRLGHYFGADRFGYQPDIITCAKGMTSGYSPHRRDDRHRPDHGAVPAGRRRRSPHGFTFGGHPVSAAVALANLDIFEREELNEHVLAQRPAPSGATLEKLHDLPIVGDVRGDGYFYGIELVKDKATTRDLRRRRVRAAAARLPVQGAVRRRALLPGRRPRRPGHPARAAADLRPVALRRDGADPAVGADRGMDPALTALRPSARTTVRRLPEKQVHDRAALDAVLDAGRVAHVAVHDDDGQPYVVPVAYARDGDTVLFHGSTASRLFRSLAGGAPTCLTVTLLDGLVRGPVRVRVVDALPVRDGARRPRPCSRATTKLRRAGAGHRAPDARPVGRRPAAEPQGARRDAGALAAARRSGR